MVNYVNGIPVDQLKIIPIHDGYKIEYIEKFNILKATQREIIERLMSKNLKCFPSIHHKQKIIILYLNKIDDVWEVVSCLNLQDNDYEIDYEQKLIVVDM